MALIRCNKSASTASDSMVYITNSVVYGLGCGASQFTEDNLVNGAVSGINGGNVGKSFFVNIKGKGYTNMNIALSTSTMHRSLGIKADGTVVQIEGGSSTGSATNDVTGIDFILITVTSNAGNLSLTFT